MLLLIACLSASTPPTTGLQKAAFAGFLKVTVKERERLGGGEGNVLPRIVKINITPPDLLFLP